MASGPTATSLQTPKNEVAFAGASAPAFFLRVPPVTADLSKTRWQSVGLTNRKRTGGYTADRCRGRCAGWTFASRKGAVATAHDRGSESTATGLDQSLPRAPKWVSWKSSAVATATAVLSAVAAVEASVHAPTSADCVGARPRAGMEVVGERARPLVACRRRAHEPRATHTLLHPHGTGLAARYSAASSAWVMNRRRMRTRV